MHFEGLGVTAFAGFPPHAHGAFLRVVQAEIAHALLHKEAVGLARGGVGEELTLEILLAREDPQGSVTGDLERLVDLHNVAGVQVDELEEIVEFQGEDVVFFG